MGWRTHVWRQLIRPRQRVGRRVTRMGRGSRGGVALLTTIALVALMGVIVTEITFMATMRLQLAANQRDEAKAEALAQAGVQFYRLILIASKQLGQSPMIQSLGPMLGVNADTLWQLVPEVGSGFLRFLLMADGDKEEASELARDSTKVRIDFSLARVPEDLIRSRGRRSARDQMPIMRSRMLAYPPS